MRLKTDKFCDQRRFFFDKERGLRKLQPFLQLQRKFQRVLQDDASFLIRGLKRLSLLKCILNFLILFNCVCFNLLGNIINSFT